MQFCFLLHVNSLGNVGIVACQAYSFPSKSFIPFKHDPEIEKTFRSRRKKQKLEKQRHKDTTTSIMGGEEARSTLKDYVTLWVQGLNSSITHLNVEAHISSSAGLNLYGAIISIWRLSN